MYSGYYVFWDNQLGGKSAHRRLETLCDMLLQDERMWIGTAEERDGDRERIESFDLGKWTDQEMKDYIGNHGYVVEEVTDELLKEEGISFAQLKRDGWE